MPPYYRRSNDKWKEPLPNNISEVPGYIKRVVTGFFRRLIYIFLLVWETRPWILFVMLFMALYNGFSPVISALIRSELLNRLVSAYNREIGFDMIMGLLIIQFAYMFLNRMIGDVNSIFSRISGELVTNHIKVKIMEKSKEVDLASFDMPEFYEKLENANREAGSRPVQILTSTFRIVSTTISMVSFILILWAVNPAAPGIIILFSIPSAVVNFIYRGKNADYIRTRSKDRRQMGYYSGLITNKDMVKEIRLFGLSDFFIDRYNKIFEKYFGGHKKLIVKEGVWNVAISVINITVNCLLFLYIAYEVCEGRMTIGAYSLYTGALSSISSEVSSLINTTAQIYEGTLFIDNMIAFMNEEQTVTALLSPPAEIMRGKPHVFEFKNVSFRYPGTERDVIKNVNLTISAGETVVLVGLNGAGKTTLIKLMTRLYDPTEGEILLDGRDIREYDTHELYKIYGIIFQDFGRYAVTVNENILFGNIRRDEDEAAIRDSTVQSSAAEFIERLPDGYETPLMRHFEENGVDLSIGQWQKMAISRAFYSDADVLILDEPTASLDALAEQEIFTSFDKLRKDKTTLFVSHRLSSATLASKIIVMQYGEIIEEGTHAELMRLGGHYYKLFSTQASRYIDNTQQVAEGARFRRDGEAHRAETGGEPNRDEPRHGESMRGEFLRARRVSGADEGGSPDAFV